MYVYNQISLDAISNASTLGISSSNKKPPHDGRAYKTRDIIRECATIKTLPLLSSSFSVRVAVHKDIMKKALGETQTLRADCSKMVPKNFAPGSAGQPKCNQLEMVTTVILVASTPRPISHQPKLMHLTEARLHVYQIPSRRLFINVFSLRRPL